MKPRKTWKNKWAASNPEAYKKYQREYRLKRAKLDPEFKQRVNTISERYNSENPNIKQRARFRRVYKLTNEQIDELELQSHCKICKTSFTKTKRVFDHDHKTGILRGVLCSRCNLGLGHFLDNPDLLRGAVQYLGGP